MLCVGTPYGTKPETVNATLALPSDRSSQRVQGNASQADALQATPLSIALDLQSKVFISLCAIAAVLFGISLVLLLLKSYLDKRLVDSDPGPGRRFLQKAPPLCVFFSTGLAFASALAVMQAGNALEFATTGSRDGVIFSSGKALQVLQWLVFAFSALFSFVLAVWMKGENGDDDDSSSEYDSDGDDERPPSPKPKTMPPRPAPAQTSPPRAPPPPGPPPGAGQRPGPPPPPPPRRGPPM